MLQETIVISRAGGPEVLVPQQRPVPAPGPDEVLIRVRWAGINRHDCGQRSRGPSTHESDVPGLEVAGHVEAVGANVRGLAPGAEVCALVDGGGYAQYATAHRALVLPRPDTLTLQEAACFPEAAFTVWYNFFSVAAMQPGERVLIHGGTSGIGVFAIQLLRALGHSVYATSGSEEKAAFARSLGAARVFNYKTEAFAEVMAREGLAADVILDMSGGRHTEQNLAALAYGGRIVHLSGGSGAPLQASLRAIMQKEARITGSLMRPLPLDRKTRVAEALRSAVWPLLGTAIRPVIHRTYPLAQAAQAHRDMETGDHIGKLLLDVQPS
ncbi:MAG: NAD(P)H-quinone oxidoreductase [Pigmentiphaga sp.]|uniref:NAD(P)H-quinone oxidoreductase n=1 Tax=Pigmentiphaga sp. TaxID=1977564 RepID=UPI0029B30E5A|nr:NAD(P)H-quinone oxidoreductase [Pigmentiphaga sp.]MDX3908147.1 NAD(P)H-quinone oxidoreductase [Pigmentiphaga sp.]